MWFSRGSAVTVGIVSALTTIARFLPAHYDVRISYKEAKCVR
jgi:hypothetical protein